MVGLTTRFGKVREALQRAASGEQLTPELASDALALLEALDSERRAAEGKAEDAEKLRLLWEATTDGLWVWNLTDDQVRFSPEWKGTLGYEDHEVENNVGTFFKLLHPDDIPAVDAALKLHFNERAPYAIQFRMRTKDGGWKHILARGQAVWDAEGKAVRMAGTHTDITDRVEQARALLEAKEQQIALQKTIISALGCPVLQVRRDVLCVPLIGPFDRDRAAELTESLLSAVVRLQTRTVIVDLTGAQLLDEPSVQHVAQVFRAVRLLGARCVLSGASPAMAKAMVEFSASFGDVPSYLTLEAAVQAA